MSSKNEISNFGNVIQETLHKDLDELISALATHVDENVIDQKFQEGFPGHKLTERTIRKKGHNRVGEDTGALRRAATLWTNWSIWPTSLGNVRPAMVKKRHGLTAYANMVKTKIGGVVDYLAVEGDDVVKMQDFIRWKMKAKGYSGDFGLKIYEKAAEE